MWRRHRRLFWIFGWLVVLAPVVHGIFRGQFRPAWLAVAALLLFAALYGAAIMLAFGHPERLRTQGLLLAALTGLTLAATVGFGGSWLFLFTFLSAAFAAGLPRPQNVVAVVVITATTGVVALAHGTGASDTANYLLSAFASGMITAFIVRLRGLIRELRETREELARLAVEEERLRFSRDLHDLLGHTLSLIVVKSEAVRRVVHKDPDAAAREAADIEEVGRQALAEVREAVTGYRQRGLAAELDGARSALAGAGIEATVRQSGTPLPPAADALIGWAVREGVTNVIRHSRARSCEIEVQRRDGYALLEVLDDGVGGDGGTGSGLRGLAERASFAGGRLEAGPRPGGGFRLAVSVPLEDGAERAAEPEAKEAR